MDLLIKEVLVKRLMNPYLTKIMRGSESFIRGGPTMTTFLSIIYLVDEVREDANTTVKGPLSTRQRKFRLRANSGPTLLAW